MLCKMKIKYNNVAGIINKNIMNKSLNKFNIMISNLIVKTNLVVHNVVQKYQKKI